MAQRQREPLHGFLETPPEAEDFSFREYLARQTIYNYMEDGFLSYYQLKSGGGRRLRWEDQDTLLELPTQE